MNLKNIPRETILKPLQAVVGIVERRQTLPILANVLIEATPNGLAATATDLELQITARSEFDAPESGPAVTVSARKLVDILRALPEESSISLEVRDGKLAVKAGKSRFSLQTLPAADYPRLQMNEGGARRVELAQGVFKSALRLVEFAMAQQDIRFYLNGMLLEVEENSVTCVATDGHRLSYATVPAKVSGARQEVIVPRKTVLELAKLLSDKDDPVEIDLLAHQVRFAFGAVELTSKVIDGKFPDYQRVIPSTHSKRVVLDRQQFLSMLQRVAILSNERFRGVRLSLEAGMLRITCTNNEQEEAHEELEVSYDGPTVETGFNINYLLDVMSTVAASEVMLSLQDANSSALVTIPERNDFKYVVMPMRI
ncbi:MAG: DNA polymerase III subunit beta [Casimicrobiaceae bacterium]|nr:DNA polymerase III subunit beta [Casimicrobiaceae bacterium]MCX8099010.1 DNA polymerase III subunit beta [Casimicrobiaceae bacterium]MDW8311462.1 DNA polymerase III subunit beta [Burkholderiales bacterium]